jgi:exosortase/archaeosortase family protein
MEYNKTNFDGSSGLMWSLGLPRTMTKASSAEKEDLSWPEVVQLGKRYLRIPLALIFAEALYWFLTMPTDSLALLQVTEAWVWHGLTNLLYGDGVATLSTHNGWMTRIDFHHPSFPGPFDSVGLYVSDECAGVHEMVFLSTLIWMTDGVPQKLKLKSIAIGAIIVYILNILRLVVFYPIALENCLEQPNEQMCLQPMWEYHAFVYEIGFLVVLVLLWLVWFSKVGGPARINDAAFNQSESGRIIIRKNWEAKYIALAAIFTLVVLSSIVSIYTSDEATSAKYELDWCEFSELTTPECQDAQRTWDNAIETAWSLSVLGAIGVVSVVVKIDRPETMFDGDGTSLDETNQSTSSTSNNTSEEE